jgi:hypothetical protein
MGTRPASPWLSVRNANRVAPVPAAIPTVPAAAATAAESSISESSISHAAAATAATFYLTYPIPIRSTCPSDSSTVSECTEQKLLADPTSANGRLVSLSYT